MADTQTPMPKSQGTPAPAAPRPGMGLIKGYLCIYLLLALGYGYFSFTAEEVLTPTAFTEMAFPGTAGLLPEHPLSAFDAERGHLLLWENLTFKFNGVQYRFPADERITADEAVILARYLATLPADETSVAIKVNRYDFPEHTWAVMMTIFNLAGLFLFLVVFLREPITGFLDGQAADTARALATARDAQAEAERLKDKYAALVGEIEAEKTRLAETAKEELAKEREHILHTAKHEAEGMLGILQSHLDTELAAARTRLQREVSLEALALARELVKTETTEADHQRDVEAFIRQLEEAERS